LRDLALSVPIFGDPVRLPDHNFALPESLVTHELTLARSLLFSDHCRRKNFLAAIPFQLPGRVSLPILEDDCLSALSSGRSLFR
jgi:hypothetical protein